VYNWGTSDHKDAVQAVTKLFAYQVAFKDPFYTKHRLSDKEVETLVDKRFFAGGEYFVDTSEKQ
jgi:sulfonate transport system substrate-binding protein